MAKPKAQAGNGGHRVGGAAALRALASATRQEIVDVLTSSGPVTVAELAALLGRRPDALYFHVRALQKAGLVNECDPRSVNGRATAVYAVPGPIRLDYERGSRRGLARVVRLAIKLAQREFERECLSGRPAGSGRARTLWGGRIMGWVNAAELARVNALLEELHTLLRPGRPGPGRQAISVGFLLAPAGFGDRQRRAGEKEKR